MTHLTAEQFVEALDGALSGVHARHLDACEACQRELGDMRRLLTVARADEMPEPSPLFWEHLSARVAEATTQAPAAGWWTWAWRPLAAIAVSCAAVALVLVMQTSTPAPSAVAAADEAAGVGAFDAEPWGAAAQLTAKLSPAEAEQMALASGGTAAGIIADLTPEQRAALIKLIKAEIARGE